LNGVFAVHHVPHETGHVIGYVHENARNDFVRPLDWNNAEIDCGVGSGPIDDTVNTAPDVDSVMVPNQCRPTAHPMSFWDAVGAQARFGSRVAPIFPLVSWSKNGVRATANSSVAAARFKPDGHKPAYPEGWIWTYIQPPPYGPVPGTQAVTLYENTSTRNYALAGNSSTQSELTAAGFTSLGINGFVEPSVTTPLLLKQYSGSASFFDYDLDSGYAYPAGLTQLTPDTFLSVNGFVIPVTSTGYGG
jgi:hypothetical protein